MPRRSGAESSIRRDGTLANGNVKLTTQRAHVTPRRRRRARESFLHHLVAAKIPWCEWLTACGSRILMAVPLLRPISVEFGILSRFQRFD